MSSRAHAVGEKPDKPLGAKLLYVSSARDEGDWHSTPHTHYFTEILYITRGGGRFTAEKTSFTIQENDVVLVNPNVPHTEESAAGAALEYIVLGIEGISFTFGGENSGERCRLFRRPELREFWRFCLENLLREVEEQSPYYHTVCRGLLDMLLIRLFRLGGEGLVLEASRKAGLACAVARRYIEEHFGEPVDLQQLADLVHMSKYYLAHSFTETYGQSPIQYLLTRRVEECKTLLKTTDYSVSQIAVFTGFSSQSYLAQCFRRLTGLRPGDYRKRERENG